jgi:aromatic-L-amino-acid decarboxylase
MFRQALYFEQPRLVEDLLHTLNECVQRQIESGCKKARKTKERTEEKRQMDEIRQLEKTARLMEPDAVQRERLLSQAVAYAEKYLAEIPSMPAHIERSDTGCGLGDSPIAENGISIDEALALLQENVNSVGINPTSGRFLGYIPGGGLFHSALGDFLAAVTNRYSGIFFASPGAVRMENLLLRWMADVVGYPNTAAGNLASGGSIANLTAIVTARDAFGITGEAVEKAVVYVTEQVHHCIDKALSVAGLANCVKRTVRVDAGYRMDPADLAEAVLADKKAGLRPWLIVASAGTTNTGAVDPLSDICDIAHADELWFHVDGAYGAFFALCPEGQAVLQGMDRSDSIVMDPHKTLFLPYGTGAVLVKDRGMLLASYTADADYMDRFLDDAGELSPADLSPELTKHFRGLRLWLPLKLLGVEPFRAALSEKIQLARYFHEQIQKIDGFEVGPYPDLSVVTYRYVPQRGDANAFNLRLTEAVQQDGRIFISNTRLGGKLVLRLAISCFRTHLEDIDTALDVLNRHARQLADG